MKDFRRMPYAVGILTALCMAGCGDDPGSSPNETPPAEPECTVNACLDEAILNSCEDGSIVPIDCSEKGMVCQNDACVAKEKEEEKKPECSENACDPDGVTLLRCDAGTIIKVNCADDGLICKDNQCAPKPVVPIGCTETICDDDGITLHECISGKIVTRDCSADGLVCLNKACAVQPCTEGEKECDGHKLMVCQKGKMVLDADCKKDGQACLENDETHTLQCQDVECFDDEYQPACTTKSELRHCVDYHIVTDKCKDGEYCSFTECIPDPCASCGDKQYCIDDKCLDTLPNSLIGIPCKCESEDCSTHVTGEFIKKTMFTPMALFVLEKKISNDAEIVFPDFFSPSTRGCEILETVVPDGMTVGCFRESDITFDESFNTFTKTQFPSLLSLLIGELSDTMKSFIASIVAIMETGAHYTAPGGYCMTSAVDIQGTVNNKSASMAVSPTAFSKGGFVDVINTGSHDTVVKQSAASSGSYCPEGSKLFSLAFNKEIPKLGPFKVGYDLCLKSCTSNKDCREGYSCIDVPTAIPASLDFKDAPKDKACFNKENIDTLKSLLGIFLSAVKSM